MDEKPAPPAPLPVPPVRGMRDLLPAECELRDSATATILDVYRRHGFQRIETPVLEHLALLLSGQGGENEKLIFKVLRRGEDLQRAQAAAAQSAADGSGPAAGAELADTGLRFDLTVPLARYYAAHRAELPLPFRAIQIGPVFRAERPQKGRYRQFTQCDIDVLGEPGPAAETELIVATVEALAELGLDELIVRVNDRRLLRALAVAAGVTDETRQDALFVTLDKLDRLGAEGVLAELQARGFEAGTGAALRRLVLDLPASTVDAATQLKGFASAIGVGGNGEITDATVFNGERAIADLHAILAAAAGVLAGRARLVFDPTLVRGMGYYTGPIFEVGLAGLPYSLAGGGRYDRMIGRISGRDVPACGFSIGFERVLLLLAERGVKAQAASVRLALLWDPAVDSLERVTAEADQLRRQGNAVSIFRRHKKAGRQLHELSQAGFDGAATLPAEHRAPEIDWFTKS